MNNVEKQNTPNASAESLRALQADVKELQAIMDDAKKLAQMSPDQKNAFEKRRDTFLEKHKGHNVQVLMLRIEFAPQMSMEQMLQAEYDIMNKGARMNILSRTITPIDINDPNGDQYDRKAFADVPALSGQYGSLTPYQQKFAKTLLETSALGSRERWIAEHVVNGSTEAYAEYQQRSARKE